MTDLDDRLPSDGLDDPGPVRRRPARLLLAVAAAETATLLVLLVNVAVSARSPALAAAIGPVHGALYLSAVLLTWTAPFPRAVKVAAALPVAGAGSPPTPPGPVPPRRTRQPTLGGDRRPLRGGNSPAVGATSP